MKPRHLSLLIAAGISIWLWSNNPRTSAGGEATEPFQEAEVWLGGHLVNRPEQSSAPPPQMLAEGEDAGAGTTAGEQGEEVIRTVPQSTNAAGRPAAAQAADKPPKSEKDSPIVTALDECLRQNRVSTMKPPRPLRESIAQLRRPRPVADDRGPAPAARRRFGKSVPGDTLESRSGSPRPGQTHEQVSYVVPRVQSSSVSEQGDEVSEDPSAQGPSAAESPSPEAANSPSPARHAPRPDAALTGLPESPARPPQMLARHASAGSTPMPEVAGASPPTQSSLTQLLTLLGIVALVLAVQRRWGAGQPQREPAAAPAASPAAVSIAPALPRPLMDTQGKPSSDLANELENGLVAAAVAWNVKLRNRRNEPAAATEADSQTLGAYP